MKLIFLISFRNLIRQKRRNIQLGIAIAFGIVILTIANAFSKGITDNLLNRLIVFTSGHMKISMIESGRVMNPIIRDRAYVLKTIKSTVTGISNIEEDLGAFGRMIGNGKGDYVFLAGVKLNDEFKSYFRALEGSYENYDKGACNPVIISEQKAKYLNVKIGDQVRMRFDNVNGQKQTAIFTVKVIIKSQNIFMDYAVFTPFKNLKQLMGYKKFETAALKIILDDPRTAAEKADLLHKALEPDKACIWSKTDKYSNNLLLVPFIKGVSLNAAGSLIKMPADTEWDSDTKGAVISSVLADKLKLGVGDRIKFKYKQRYFSGLHHADVKISAIALFNKKISPDTVFVSNESFFRIYNYFLPEDKVRLEDYIQADHKDPVWDMIASEWHLLKRTRNTDDFAKKFKDLMRDKKYQPSMDIATMYETASEIIKMEYVFNLVTFLAASVIFFIIMIGVLNSLRMTVRERTREIGTVRSIGMRRSDVKKVFMMETFLLTVLSWLAGLIISLIVMKLLTLIHFSYDNPLNMLMVDRRLYFVPTLWSVFRNLIIVFAFSMATAFFPSSKAASLKPSEALRHTT
ncbi:MAG: FtsX-like permease family protein [bacterium]|nr:FtsX-like permease family protein [bacterium]